MIEQLTQLMVHSGAAWVLWVLIALSIASLGIAIERLWALRRQQGDVAALVPELRKCLRGGDEAAARALLDRSSGAVPRIVATGLSEARQGPEAAEEAMAAAMGLEKKRLEKRLMFLGTVGNNAPFVGLLGTVIGIVGAFEALGHSTGTAATALAPEKVMASIAEALVATAVGLVVAIPAVAAFNYLQGRVSAVMRDAETLGHVLLAHLRGETESRTGAK